MSVIFGLQFNEFITLFSFVVMAAFSFISLKRSVRSLSIKIVGLFLIITICVYANNLAVYTIAVFIVGTTITSREFLENIAAIFKGSKEYFDYKKETLDSDEKEEKIKEDLLEQKVSTFSLPDLSGVLESGTFKSKPSMTLPIPAEPKEEEIDEFREIQSLAMKKIDSLFHDKLERFVRVSNEEFSVEVDAAISRKDRELIFGIRQIDDMNKLKESVLKLKDDAKRYSRITRKRVVSNIVIVSDKLKKDEKKILQEITKYALSIGFDCKFMIFNKKDIGFKS